MRKITKTGIVLLALIFIAVGIVGLQAFLAHQLGCTIRERAIPAIKERLNLDVSFEKVGVNLPAGDMTLHGVRVANPPIFVSEDMVYFRRGSVRLDPLDFLRGEAANGLRVHIKDGLLKLIRDRDGRLNIREAARGFHQAKRVLAPPSSESGAEDESAISRFPNFNIRDATASFLVLYTDLRLHEQRPSASARVNVTLKNLSNHGPADQLSCAVALRGEIVGNGSGVFELHGVASPIRRDASQISFVASVTIHDLALDILKALSEERGLKHESVSGTLNLKCDGGTFDADKSELTLAFHDVRFTGEMAGKTMGLESLPSFTIAAPIGGNLRDGPDVDFKSAVQRGMMSDETLGAVVEGIRKQQNSSELPDESSAGAEYILDGKKLKKERRFDLRKIIEEIRKGPR